MKHNPTIFVATIVVVLVAAACGGRNSRTNASTPADRFAQLCGDRLECPELGLTVVGIEDRAGRQPAALFQGSAGDSLLFALAGGADATFRSAFNVYLVTTADHTLLVDAGLGPKAGGTLLPQLDSLGVSPDQVADILITHIHPDHIGGLVADGRAVFANATLHLSGPELESGSSNPVWQQVAAAYEGRIDTAMAAGELFGRLVKAIPAYGHTPGHTLYQIGPCLMVGDLLHAQDLQLDNPDYCARFDGSPDQARATRKAIYDRVRAEGLYLCGAHCYERFIKP